MALSSVGICNLALSRIGISATISSLTDTNSQEAVSCNAIYATMIDAVLRDFAWPFADAYAELGLVHDSSEDDVAWANRWLYAYRYPSDCIRALTIEVGDRTSTTRVPFELSNDASGRLILTDQDDAVLRYTKRFTDPAHFDPSFASALAWRLAMELAPPLSRSSGMIERAENGYLASIRQAQVNAVNEIQADAPPDAPWIQARD